MYSVRILTVLPIRPLALGLPYWLEWKLEHIADESGSVNDRSAIAV